MSHDFLEEFIAIYKSETCLWQVKDKEYHDKIKKDAAYQRLIEKLREIEPNAFKDMVVKKINNIRSAYRKEIKKMKASIKSGAAVDDVYQPKLWYFNLLRFLDDPDTPRTSCSNLDSSDDDTTDIQVESEEIEKLPDRQEETASEQSSGSASHPASAPRRNKKRALGTEQNSLTEKVLQTVETHFKRPEDRFDVMGKTVAMKLRDLPKEQMLIAEKLINETLFEAEMGNLTLLHRLLSQPHFSQNQQPFQQYQRPSTTFSQQYRSASHSTILTPLHSPVYQQSQLPYPQENGLQPSANNDPLAVESAASFISSFQE